MGNVAENVARVRERIRAAESACGRAEGSVTLIAVTKTVPVERMAEAAAAGIRDFGENYYQEAREKLHKFGPDIRWHFIGHLQSNKARQVAGRFTLVHGVDSARLARELGKRAAALGMAQPVLLEVKLDPAETRHGVDPESVLDLAAELAQTQGIELHGLMGIAPYGADSEAARPCFSRLRALFDRLPLENRRVLSMGMTADFEDAIMEGATHVRIGTAVFGQRS